MPRRRGPQLHTQFVSKRCAMPKNPVKQRFLAAPVGFAPGN
jgi:hypothetical protein